MELTVLPDVELCQIGTWDASTGRHTFTTEDWADAVAATSDPAFRAPQVYIGHDHAVWGDGEPSVGHIENLRVSDDGVSLRGDLHLLPAVAELAPVVWPSRSIEGQFAVTSSTGNSYRLILTGLALLGAQLPAVETLDDLTALAGIAASAPPAGAFTLTLGGQTPMTTPANPDAPEVAASTNVENVRRAWWDRTDDLRAGIFVFSWVRAVYAGDEQFIVVETDEADDDTGVYLFQVPWTETDGAVEFGEPVPVREAFLPADTTSQDDAAAMSGASALLARWAPLRDGATPALSEGQDPTTTSEVTHMSDTAPASDAAETTEAAAPVAAAAGVVQVDENVLAELRAGAAAGAAAQAELARIRHEGILDAAVKAGKVSPASRESFAAALADNEAATVAIIETLAPGAPVVELGAATDPTTASDDALYAELFGTTEA